MVLSRALAHNCQIQRKAVFRPIEDATDRYARGQAGRSVESRWLLLAAIVRCSERLECDSCSDGRDNVAGVSQKASRDEAEMRYKKSAGRRGKRLESLVQTRRTQSVPLGKRRLANGEIDKVKGYVAGAQATDRGVRPPSTPFWMDR